MSDCLAKPQAAIRSDGSIEYGGTVIRAWPSLRMRPKRTMEITQEIIWAERGDRFWPFASRIPPLFIGAVRTAPVHAWDLLELAAAAPDRGWELIRQCPALALLTARSCPPDCRDPGDYCASILALSWRQILGALGLPAERRLVRILRKISLPHCGAETLETLRGILRDGHPHLRTLSHLSTITRDTIALMRLSPLMVNPLLLFASGDSDYDEEPVRWCLDTIAWFRDQEEPGRPWPYGKLDPLALARVAARYRRRLGEQGEYLTPFPPPPIPGVPGRITALRDFFSLSREGRQQNNCVEALAPDVLSGRIYVYAVNVRERATLAIRRKTVTGSFEVEDLRGADNAAPSDETERFVGEWLCDNQAEPFKQKIHHECECL